MTKCQFGQLIGTPGDLGGPISVSPAVGGDRPPPRDLSPHREAVVEGRGEAPFPAPDGAAGPGRRPGPGPSVHRLEHPPRNGEWDARLRRERAQLRQGPQTGGAAAMQEPKAKGGASARRPRPQGLLTNSLGAATSVSLLCTARTRARFAETQKGGIHWRAGGRTPNHGVLPPSL